MLLVTGGTGYLGSVVVTLLADEGRAVVRCACAAAGVACGGEVAVRGGGSAVRHGLRGRLPVSRRVRGRRG